MFRKKKSDLTDEQAAAMLKQLTEHYGERVAPVSDYCRAFMDYAHAIRENFRDAPDMHPMVRHIPEIIGTIDKSNLLARLVYGGEKLRKRKCPIHGGTWTGVPLSASQDCPKGCGLTGWIPEPEDGGPPLGSDPETWTNNSQWRIFDTKTGEETILTHEEMLEYDREREEERRRKEADRVRGPGKD